MRIYLAFAILAVTNLHLPYVAKSQDLFSHPDGTITTNQEKLFAKKDKIGTRVADQRFIKRNDSIFIELEVREQYADMVNIKEGYNLIFYFQMHKGQVKTKANKINITWHPHKPFSSKKISHTVVEYFLSEAQVDSIIQNKSRNITMQTTVDVLDVDIENEWNYNLRSAASAIISGRDIHDDKIKVKLLKKN